MHTLSKPLFFVRARFHRVRVLAVFACTVLPLIAAAGARCQDNSALKPPAGARVAIIEFDDLQCPSCAHANPLLEGAAAKYKIPWIRHDLLIPYHNWSKAAAVNARWFDMHSKALGDEYRNQVFASQISIETPIQLNQFTERFAQSHNIAWPMMGVDPQGKLLDEVNADVALGTRIGITLTPTIYIAIANSKAAPYIQVKDVDRDLYQDIDQAFANARPPATVKTAHK
jgi:protein-disulfide isomerase